MASPPDALPAPADLLEALIQGLSGRDHPLFSAAPGPELQERAARGDPTAEGALWVLAHAAVLPHRLRAATRADRARISLADGSTLERGDAERILARKEEARVFAPLRELLDDVARAERPRGLDEELVELAPAEHAEERLLEELEALLAALEEPGHVARELLATLGRCALDDGPALERALDLPDDEGAFSVAAARHLWGPVKEALAPALQRPLSRLAVPRALAGVAGVLGRGCFVGVAPCLRAERFSRVLEGGCRALVAAGFETTRDEDHDALLVLGGALHHGLLVPWSLPFSRASSERVVQILRARAVLDAELAAVLARCRLRDGAEEEAAREALFERFGQAPAGWVEQLFRAPWPGGSRPRGPVAALLERALTPGRAAAAAAVMRDRLDIAWPSSRGWTELVRDHHSPGNLLESLEIHSRSAAPLVDWLHEMV